MYRLYRKNDQWEVVVYVSKLQWTLVTMTAFVPKDIAIKMNLLL